MLKLDHYPGPNIDVGPAVTAMILSGNGQVLHRLMHQPITPDELLDKNGSDTQDKFIAIVYVKPGS